jgi:hypothetical protein
MGENCALDDFAWRIVTAHGVDRDPRFILQASPMLRPPAADEKTTSALTSAMRSPIAAAYRL